jgi:hypothetical protein
VVNRLVNLNGCSSDRDATLELCAGGRELMERIGKRRFRFDSFRIGFASPYGTGKMESS